MSIISAGTTTTTSLVQTGNTDGTLQLQVNGTTPSVTLNTSGAVGVGSTPSFGTAGQVLTSQGSGAAPTWTSGGSSQWTTSGSNIYYNTGNVGVGTTSPARRFQVNSGEAVAARFTRGGGIVANNSLEWFDGTNGWYAGVSGSNFWGVAYNSSGAIDSAAIRLDSSGNLGLGVTPSAWITSWRAADIGRAAIASPPGTTGTSAYATNAFLNTSGAWTYKSSDFASSYVHSDGQHRWNVAPSGTAGNAISFTQAMTLDASGNLGVGTTTPSSFDGSADNLVVGTTTGNNGITIAAATAGASTLNFADGTSGGAQYAGYIDYQHSGDFMRFGTNLGNERMRITSGGALLVGTTSGSAPSGQPTAFQVGDGNDYMEFGRNAGISVAQLTMSVSTSVSRNVISFRNTNGYVGNIQISGSATSYLTSSDYRLKNSIAPMTGALAKVALLKPVTYKWNADDSDGQGFIAHELAEVVPDAVSGEKDAVETYTDEEGNEQTRPVYQGIDTSFLVATLTAAIQEQQALITAQAEAITALTARVAALESN